MPNPTDSARPGAGSKKSSVASEIQLDPEIRVELSADDVDLIEEQLGNSLEGLFWIHILWNVISGIEDLLNV